MTIEIDEKSYIVGFWFSVNPETDNNWLACVIRDPENPRRYKGWYRFRYVKDSKVFDSDDEKSWMGFYTQEDEKEDTIIEIMDGLQHELKVGYPKTDRTIVKGGMKDFVALTKDKDWIHMKQVPLND